MPTITIEPATPGRFDDVEHALTGGGDGRSCQCQWWTLTNAQFQETSTEEREQLLRDEVTTGPPPGLIAYVDGEAVGWVRVGPRTGQVQARADEELHEQLGGAVGRRLRLGRHVLRGAAGAPPRGTQRAIAGCRGASTRESTARG